MGNTSRNTQNKGGTPPDILQSIKMQNSMVNTILKQYHMNYRTEKIEIGDKTKALYITTVIYCDPGYEYVCEAVATKYLTDSMNKKVKETVDIKEEKDNEQGSK